MDMDISSGSEDGEAYVTDLLEQFSKPDGQEPTPFQNGDHEADTEKPYLSQDDNSSDETSLTELKSVEVPLKNDLSDYDILPGHSTVDEVIHQSKRTTRESFYYVQMQSGEKKTVSLQIQSFYSLFTTLQLTRQFSDFHDWS